MIPHIKTKTVLTFMDTQGTPVQVCTDHKHYDEIYSLVTSSAGTLDDYDRIMGLLKPITELIRIAKEHNTTLFIDPVTQAVYTTINDRKHLLPADLGNYIIELNSSNGDITPFVHFVRKLYKNPDPKVIQQLWGFISACGLCLSPEGNFLAYKNVRADFKSIHDGVTDNTPGSTLKMKRSEVENNPDRTCSRGLHFAAWDYLTHYSVGGKTVLISVSPKDVVSIPSDYNNQKGRACRYKVVREVKAPKELENIRLMRDEDTDYDDNE